MRRLLLALLLPVTLLAAKAARAEYKIGYVDVQRAVQEVEEGKQARLRLKGEVEDRRRQLDGKKVELTKLQGDYEKQAAVLSEDAKRKKQEELQKKLVEAQQSAQEMQEELTGKEQEAMSSISKRMLQIVAEVAEKDGLHFVLDKSALLFAPNSADITNEVVRAYNDKFAPTAATAQAARDVAEALKKAGKKAADKAASGKK